MTNEIIAPAMGLASTNLVSIVFDGGPSWPYILGASWFIILLVAPIVSLILTNRSWRKRSSGELTPHTPRLILGAALLTASVTAAQFLNGMQQTFYFIGATVSGAAQHAIFLINLSHHFIGLLLGLIATTCSLFFLLCLPFRKQ